MAAGMLAASGIALAQDAAPPETPYGLQPQTPPVQPVPKSLPSAKPPADLPAPRSVVPPSRPAPVGGEPPVLWREYGTPGVHPPQPCVAPRAKEEWKQKIQTCFIGRPEEFVAPPLGATIARHFETQVANGVAARMTLYDYDFDCGTDRLNYRGKDRVRQIACLLSQNLFPVVIERTPQTPGLAEARRAAVLTELAEASATVHPDRVVIGQPLAVPLHGREAEIIYVNLLRQTDRLGFPLYQSLYGTGGFGIGSGTSGGGFGIGNAFGGTAGFGGPTGNQ
jgi:hypothetical protein